MRWERIQRQVGLGDSSSGPGKRWGHTCNAVKGGRFVYVFGGCGGDGCLTNQVHVFDNWRKRWSELMIRGVPPSPRDSHSCTTVGDNLFFLSLNLITTLSLCVCCLATHTWKCLEARGERPEAREAHSCGKISGSDDEVFYNDLYILNTDGHTCSTWNNKIIVVGGEESEDLDDYYLRYKFVWKQLKTSGQLLTPRAGHVTVAIGSNLFVFGGLTDSQNLYNDLFVLDVETRVWSKIAMEEGPSARFSAAAVCLGPYKAGSFFFVGGCNNNLEPLDDIYYLHTDGVYEARLAQTPGRLSLRKQVKLKCQEQRVAVDQGKTVFQARVTESSPLGYTIETMIDGKVLRGKRPAMSDADFDHRAKTQKTLRKDSAGSSQQADPIHPSDDANKKVNVEPLRNEMSTDVAEDAKAGPGGDSSPQKQGDS
ncbi:hypothetical protein Bca52824_024830 [Brassica carinata]|uniref:Uncharacterized protein n=1 Tax=Brassica carinata TaxID=52824 RepID=A0A8X7VLF3_BRACI|nr:hypothetical protein Bca52824_024830 [Brassica carinata]